MRFTMSTDEKMSSDVPSFVIAQPESNAPTGKKSKRTIIYAVTGVVVAALILIAILVGIYMFTEAEKEIIKVSLQLKDDMKQDIEQNPNTNVVQLHIQQTNQETWIYNDYNSDVKVMKIKTSTGTNCFVTPLNESAPTELPNMESANQNADTVSVIYENTGTPIKDTSFLSKTSRDACNGISTYWLYPTCNSPAKNAPHNITDMQDNRQKRAVYYVSNNNCGGYYWVSNCNFYGSCTYFYNAAHVLSYTFSATWYWPGSRANGCWMRRCTSCCYGGCVFV